MNKGHLQISTLGLQHFCIRDKNPIEILAKKNLISDLSDVQTANRIDWDYLYKGNDESKHFILLTDLNDWSYLLWKYWDFETNVELAKKLSKNLNTNVNYYFVDPYIATSRWIMTDWGIVTRAYYESHGEKLFDIGTNEVEMKLRAGIMEKSVEDIFWHLYENTCLSLEYVNRQHRDELKLYTGTVNEHYHQLTGL